jgi:hypothetical protein
MAHARRRRFALKARRASLFATPRCTRTRSTLPTPVSTLPRRRRRQPRRPLPLPLHLRLRNPRRRVHSTAPRAASTSACPQWSPPPRPRPRTHAPCARTRCNRAGGARATNRSTCSCVTWRGFIRVRSAPGVSYRSVFAREILHSRLVTVACVARNACSKRCSKRPSQHLLCGQCF